MPGGDWPESIVLSDRDVMLRRWRADDAPAVTAACQDPEIGHWIPSIPVPYTLDDARAFIALTVDTWRDGTRREFAIVDRDDRLLGAIGLIGPVDHDHAAAIGYWVARDARGRGIATNAVRLLARHAFATESGLVRLALHTLAGNDASGRVAERAGFTREGVLRDYELVRGRPTDIVIYSMVRRDLPAAPRPDPRDPLPGATAVPPRDAQAA